MDKNVAIDKLKAQRDAITSLHRYSGSDQQFIRWRRDTELLIQHVFKDSAEHRKEFASISYTPSMYDMGNPGPAFRDALSRGLKRAEAILDSMINEIVEYWGESNSSGSAEPVLGRIERICTRFHGVVRQLRVRHAGRQTLDVADEYDVQDLLHCLLKVDFEDIRPEEWTPSYCGTSARMDFLLKQEGIVIEVKRMRRNMSIRDLGDQLIIDVTRYKAHPDCRRLICFVYDPEGLVSNPAAIECDIPSAERSLDVQVIIAPRN